MSIIITDKVSYKILKEIIQKPKPYMALTNMITPIRCNGTASFPSNHAVKNFAAVAFYYILFPRLK